MEDIVSFCVELARKKGASYAEARFERDETDGAMLKNGTLEATELSKGSGIGVRVLVNGCMGFASSSAVSRKSASDAVDDAIKLAHVSRAAPIELSPFKGENRKWESKERIKSRDIGIEEKISLLKDMENAIKSPSVPIRFLQISFQNNEKVYANSEGALLTSKVPRIEFHYNIVVRHGGETENRYSQWGKSGGYELLRDWDMEEKINSESKALLQCLKKPLNIPKGKTDVLISPEIVGIACHESSGHPGEGDRILGREGSQAGESYLGFEWVGKRIGSDCVTVVDDPTLENSLGFYLYDDEGVMARRRFLIKNGMISEFLHNRQSSVAFGTESNASARASGYNLEPLVRMANTFMLPGKHSFDELLEGIKKGVLMKSFTEWNIDDRRWNQKYTGSECYLIENGEIKGAVRRPVLELTTKSFYSSIDACSKDLEFFAGNCGKGDPMQGAPVWLGGPYARMRGVTLA